MLVDIRPIFAWQGPELKALAYILSLWIAAAGALPVLNFHYCHDELADWAINSEAEASCHEQVKQDHSCCESEHEESHDDCSENEHEHHSDSCDGEDGCCQDVTLTADLDADIFHHEIKVLDHPTLFATNTLEFVVSRETLPSAQAEHITEFNDLPPPDRVILFQKLQFYS